MAEFTPCEGCDEPEACEIVSRCLEPNEENEAEGALRSLACWLGVGGYNAPTVNAKEFEEKIREGVTLFSQTHGFVARDLAEVVMSMDLITPKGLRAKQLARRILGISVMDASS